MKTRIASERDEHNAQRKADNVREKWKNGYLHI